MTQRTSKCSELCAPCSSSRRKINRKRTRLSIFAHPIGLQGIVVYLHVEIRGVITRTEVLMSLLRFDRPLKAISDGVQQVGWDSDAECVTLRREHVCDVLGRYLNGALSAREAEHWANMVESREDIGFELGHEEGLKQAVFALANPILTEQLSPQRAAAIMERCCCP